MDRASLDKLYRYCLTLTGTRADAHDLLQSSIERYLKARSSDIQDPVAYIRRIARNLFYDELRRKQRVDFGSLDEPDQVAGVERELEQVVIDEQTVAELWRRLTPPEREVVHLWAVEGYTAAEIALQLGLPRGTVLARLNRMRKRISEMYGVSARGGVS